VKCMQSESPSRGSTLRKERKEIVKDLQDGVHAEDDFSSCHLLSIVILKAEPLPGGVQYKVKQRWHAQVLSEEI